MTEEEIKALPIKDKPYRKRIMKYFYVFVRPNGEKTYCLHYSFGGKQHTFTAGNVAETSFEEAKRICGDALADLQMGFKPKREWYVSPTQKQLNMKIEQVKKALISSKLLHDLYEDDKVVEITIMKDQNLEDVDDFVL